MNNADYKKIALNHIKKIRNLEDEVIPKLKSDIFNLKQAIKDGKLLELGGSEDALRKLIDILGASSLLLMRVMARRNDNSKDDIEAFNKLTKQHNDLTAELAQALENKTFVKCDCGDSYDTTSYGAGYIDACGECPNCMVGESKQLSQYVKGVCLNSDGQAELVPLGMETETGRMPLYKHSPTVRRLSDKELYDMILKKHTAFGDRAPRTISIGDMVDMINGTGGLMDACGVPKET